MLFRDHYLLKPKQRRFSMSPTLDLAIVMLATETNLGYTIMSDELCMVYGCLTQDERDEFDLIRFECEMNVA